MRVPAVFFAEIAWRWTFGAAAIALCTASLLVFLNTLEVTRAEQWALGTGTPWLVLDAVAHILGGSGPRFLLITFLDAVGLAIAWVAIASAGRVAVLAGLCGCAGMQRELTDSRLGTVVLLHVLRASLFWAAMLAYGGAAILAERITIVDGSPSPGGYLVLFIVLTIVISFVHSRLKWMASVATIFAVRDGAPSVRALARSGDLYVRHAGQITRINTVFAVVHFFAFIPATLMSVSALALVGAGHARVLGLGLAVLITLVYLAFSDFIYIARMAAYICVIDSDAGGAAPLLAADPMPTVPSAEPGFEPAT
jgi:hypothetical protein